jgi:hypothetical protein
VKVRQPRISGFLEGGGTVGAGRRGAIGKLGENGKDGNDSGSLIRFPDAADRQN